MKEQRKRWREKKKERQPQAENERQEIVDKKSHRYCHAQKEQCRETKRKWRANNKEEGASYKREYRKQHREVVNEASRRYYRNHKEQIRETRKKWLANNRDKVKAWSQKHREAVNETSRRCYHAHREQRNEAKKRWRTNDREVCNERQRRYRQRQKDQMRAVPPCDCGVCLSCGGWSAKWKSEWHVRLNAWLGSMTQGPNSVEVVVDRGEDQLAMELEDLSTNIIESEAETMSTVSTSEVDSEWGDRLETLLADESDSEVETGPAPTLTRRSARIATMPPVSYREWEMIPCQRSWTGRGGCIQRPPNESWRAGCCWSTVLRG